MLVSIQQDFNHILYSRSNYEITYKDVLKSYLSVLKSTLKAIAHCIYVRNFCTLKNKYDLMLCQSRLHTASETFVRHKKFVPGSIFCVFASVASILIGKDDKYEKNK